MRVANQHTIEMEINGRSVVAPEGASVAAVLLAHGVAARTSIAGEPRSALCGMGICMECRATVDGVAHVRTCQMTVRTGMKVASE
jgi:D-hydroxyproline dehydrogenase subunit gamma